MPKGITKQEIHDSLVTITNSARVIGAEGLVIDINDIIERIKADL